MTWVRLDDNFADNPKIEKLSDAAFRAHVRALCYCARLSTDGRIAENVVPRLGVTKKILQEFIDVGIWERQDGGWEIHDFLEYNPSAEEKAKRSAAGTTGASARWKAIRNSKTGTSRNAIRNSKAG